MNLVCYLHLLLDNIMHTVLFILVLVCVVPVALVTGHERQSTLLDESEVNPVDPSEVEEQFTWHSTVADAKSKTKKPAFTLVN